MKNILVKIISACILDKKKRHIFRKKNSNEWINVVSKNNIKISEEDIDRVSLNIDGNNNNIFIGNMNDNSRGCINICLVGNYCTVVIEDGISVSKNLNIIIGQKHPHFGSVEHVVVRIGCRTSFEECSMITYNSNSSIEMGHDCMVSSHVTLFNTDSHPIYDSANGNVMNRVKDLKIGHHCWLGAYVTVLKNTHLEDNTIVGWGSVVNRKFYSDLEYSTPPSNCILAGNPARIVKTGVSWDSDGSTGYVQNKNA